MLKLYNMHKYTENNQRVRAIWNGFEYGMGLEFGGGLFIYCNVC